MNYISLKRFARQCVCVGLMSIFIAGQSFASSVKPVGELSSGGTGVTVNGELAESGRTIFSSSTIVTPEGSGAVLNLGKSGIIELAPATSFALNADDEIGGELIAGSVTLANADSGIAIRTTTGETLSLNSGDTAIAGMSRPAVDHRDKTTGKCIDDDNDGKLECKEGLPAWAWYVIGGAVAGAIIIAVVAGGDDDNATSPVR